MVLQYVQFLCFPWKDLMKGAAGTGIAPPLTVFSLLLQKQTNKQKTQPFLIFLPEQSGTFFSLF